MFISQFLNALETVVPLAAVGYARDAVGLQVGLDRETTLTAALFAYEVTEDVIAEAKTRNANLIVAFHPLIFPNVASVTDRTRSGRLIRMLIKNDIALYVQHTAFDTHPEFGTSRLMAEALGLEQISALATLTTPMPSSFSDISFGMGALGTWPRAKKRNDVLRLIAETFQSSCVRYNQVSPAGIKSVAMVGGSGMDYYEQARLLGAHAFITADVRYHDFHRADHDNILLIDAGHAETESFVTSGMVRAARKALDSHNELLDSVNLHDQLPQRLLLLARSKPNAVRYYGRS